MRAPRRRRGSRDRRAVPGGRSVPALYGALTTGLVAVVVVVASVVTPATPPSLAELSPSARDRIEEAREEQGIGPGHGAGGRCAPDDVACLHSQGIDPTVGPGASAGLPPALEVAAGRRCYGDPPRQTEDPHSPPCVFEIFTGDNGGATSQGVTATEIRIAIPNPFDLPRPIFEALIAHFNARYEFYGRRLSPVFLPSSEPGDDPAANRAFADEVAEQRPFALTSGATYASNALLHRRLAEAGVVSAVASPAAFDSDAVATGLTWLVEPPLDVRLRTGASFVCRALKGRSARHGGPGTEGKPRKFAVVVLTEAGARLDPRPLEDGLRACGADFDSFEVPWNGNAGDYQTLMLQLKQGDFTTVLPIGHFVSTNIYRAATNVGYFPEWMDLGINWAHKEHTWAGSGRSFTQGHAEHTFGVTPEVRMRPAGEEPSFWAYREGGGTGEMEPNFGFAPYYEPLLVLASGIQGAGPNLTPETFAQALRSTDFPNPNPGAPPYWQQGIGFAPLNFVFHDDYALWWWNEDAPSQRGTSPSGRGSFCYLDRGGRFTAESFPADADTRLFSASEPCR